MYKIALRISTFVLAGIFFLYSDIDVLADSIIDITGNWRDTVHYEPTIKTRDPYLKEYETKTFEQKLVLPAGRYSLRFEYDPFWDTSNGHALDMKYESFQGLKINDKIYQLKFQKAAESEASLSHYRKEPYQASCDFEASSQNQATSIKLTIGNLRPLRTWLICSTNLSSTSRYRAVAPSDNGETLIAHGIPFLVRQMLWYQCGLGNNIDHGTIKPWNDGYTIDCGQTNVKTAHFLGMIHNIDIANGSWYSPKGDHGYNHFVGDQAGNIIISYSDGSKSEIPIIFGFNLWFCRPWDMIWHYNWYWDRHQVAWVGDLDKNLFSGINAYREIIRSSVALIDGVRAMGSASSNTRFIFSVDLENRPVKSICIKGNKEFHDYPLISGITLETSSSSDSLISLPNINAEPANTNPVSLDYIKEKKYEPQIEAVKRLLYTYVDDAPKLTMPEVPEGYFGPQYDFRGTQEAIRAATYLYYNGPGCASFIADSGMGCGSQVFPGYIMQYMDGAGFWFIKPIAFGSLTQWFKLYREKSPGNFPGEKDAWTRGIGELLRESMAFGYDKYVNTYIDWLDNALMTEANPPHWNRIAGAANLCTYKNKLATLKNAAIAKTTVTASACGDDT